MCVDYRKLNGLTKKDSYLIPLIDEMMARISKAKVFTKLDIQQAFHRIRIKVGYTKQSFYKQFLVDITRDL